MAGAYALGSGTGVVPAGACSSTLNIQSVIKAKGEAQAIELQARTINAQGGESCLRLEAIRKWNGTMPVYLGSHTPLPFVDVGVGGK